MVFSIILIVLILAVAFIHYIQGMFSALLSAILTLIAAVVAVSYHENVVALLKPGKLADSGTAVILCCLFAATYVVLRLIFDRAVPGNVRVQSTIDKVGAAIFGLIAGIFTAGIVAIAAQTMPFGPSILGYTRYALQDRKDINFQPDRSRNAITRDILDELKSPTFNDKEAEHMFLIPADDMVLGTVALLSEGSLSGTRSFNSIHADYLQEAFGTRVGVQAGTKHTATNFDGQTQQVTVDKVANPDSVRQVEDAEFPELRTGKKESAAPTSGSPDEAKLAKNPLRPGPDEAIVIVRAMFDKNATEEKGALFDFSPGAVRLVGHDADGRAKNYFPIGTMDAWSGGTFWPNRIDDFLFVQVDGQSGADLVFMVKRGDVFEDAAPAAPAAKGRGATSAPSGGAARSIVKPGTFLEVKRLARVDLSNMEAGKAILPPDAKVGVMRKTRLKAPPAPPQG